MSKLSTGHWRLVRVRGRYGAGPRDVVDSKAALVGRNLTRLVVRRGCLTWLLNLWAPVVVEFEGMLMTSCWTIEDVGTGFGVAVGRVERVYQVSSTSASPFTRGIELYMRKNSEITV